MRQKSHKFLHKCNKCVGDDTITAARRNPNYIKKPKKNTAKNDFQYGEWNYYTLQCGMWLWNHDSEFTTWQHPAMRYVALGWDAMEFAQTSAILKFYIWFRVWRYHRQCRINPSGGPMSTWNGGPSNPPPLSFPSPAPFLPLLSPFLSLALEVGPLKGTLRRRLTCIFFSFNKKFNI